MKMEDDCPTCGAGRDEERDDLYARLEAVTKERDAALREAVALNAQLTAAMATRKPADGYIACRNCPFWKHLHWEEGVKLIAPGCSGFEPEGA